MKKARVLTLSLVLCLAMTVLCPAALADAAPEIAAKNAIVIDMNTGTVLYEKDADSKAEPASTTKIMTMLIICEAVERGDVTLDDPVTAQGYDVYLNDDDACTAGIKAGETMTLRDLCCCAMLSSANEACNVAASYVAGSVSKFVELMNEKAAALGCENTHFVNTNGLPSSKHYTTARELALITQEALKYDVFRELCGMTEHTVPATNISEPRKLSNSNALINAKSCYGDKYLYEGAYGVKTGHTEAAGYCLVSAVKSGDFDMIAVVLGSDGDGVKGEYFNNFADTVKLLDYCRSNWKETVVLSTKERLGEVTVEMGVHKSASLAPAEDIIQLLPVDFDLDSIKCDITIDKDSITAPVREGTVLGKVIVRNADGNIIGTADLVTPENVHASIAAYVFANAQEFVSHHLTGIGIFILVLIVAAFLAIYIPAAKKGKKKK